MEISVPGHSSSPWLSANPKCSHQNNQSPSSKDPTKPKQKKARPGWAEALGIKKDVMQFLTCLRNIRFDFRCFGSFHNGADITTDDEDEDEEDDEDEDEDEGCRKNLRETNSEASRTVFSKWFMVLQEEQNNNNGFLKDDRVMKKQEEEEGSTDGEAAVPPPNALMLMRCRSAPAKSWLEEQEEDERESQDEKNIDKDKYDEEEETERMEKKCSKNSLKCLMEDENRKTTENNLVVMRYGAEFYKISSDIAKETWVVGGNRDPFSRSRSWKR